MVRGCRARANCKVLRSADLQAQYKFGTVVFGKAFADTMPTRVAIVPTIRIRSHEDQSSDCLESGRTFND
jgi:hypothetical protein